MTLPLTPLTPGALTLTRYVSTGPVTISADTAATGSGDIIFETNGNTERGRIHNAGDLLFKYAVAFNGGGFTNAYDTALWIAPATRNNPTNNFQGLYIQSRITGDLGALVHDAAASELRMSGVTNGGAAENAHEFSLVVSGGANNISALNSAVANFHTENSPSGSVTSVTLLRASTVPALTGTFTIGTLYGLYLESQTVGGTNYSLYVAGGDSVIQGQIRPSSTSAAGLVIRGLASQGTTQPMFAVQNNTPTTLFSILVNGTGGMGGQISGPTFWINNNLATASTVVFVVRGHSSQSADLQQWQDSTPTTHMSITAAGLLRWNAAADVQTTVGSAGGASALPASPTKYLKVVADDGTTYVVPAFAAA